MMKIKYSTFFQKKKSNSYTNSSINKKDNFQVKNFCINISIEFYIPFLSNFIVVRYSKGRGKSLKNIVRFSQKD